MAKGLIASMDVLVGALAFSAFFLVFLLSTVLAQNSVIGALRGGAWHINTEARAQHAIFLIDELGLNLSNAGNVLSYYMGNGTYVLEPFLQNMSSGYQQGYGVSRLVVISGNVYYLGVIGNGA